MRSYEQCTLFSRFFMCAATQMGQNLSEKQLGKAFKQLDTDGSGSVDYAEFVAWSATAVA